MALLPRRVGLPSDQGMLVGIERLERRRLLSATGIHARGLKVIGAVAGESFDQKLATITYPAGATIGANARVTWGDGTSSTTRSLNPPTQSGELSLTAAYTYAKPGIYLARIEFLDGSGTPAATVLNRIVVARNSAGGRTLALRTGHSFEQVIGTFASPSTPTGAAVTWGDGTQSLGQIKALGKNTFQVVSSHTYDKAGTYRIRAVLDYGGQTPLPIPGVPQPESAVPMVSGAAELIDGTGRVVGPPRTTPKPNVTLTAPAAQALYSDSGALATLTGLAPSPYEEPYAAIDFGDGFRTNGMTLKYQNGQYTISDALSFAESESVTFPTTRSATIAVRLNDHVDPTQNTTLATVQTTITIEPTSRGGATLHLAAGQPFSGSLGVLYALAGRTPLSVTINSWGEGVMFGDNVGAGDPTTLVPLGNGEYQVDAAHTFAAVGTYQITGVVHYADPSNQGSTQDDIGDFVAIAIVT